MRRGRFVLGVFSFGLLSIGVCLGLFRWVMVPPPAAPDLATRPTPRVERVTRRSVSVAPDALERCPVTVTILREGTDEPIPGARLYANFTAEGDGLFYPWLPCHTDAEGRCAFETAPCGALRASATAEGFTPAFTHIEDTAFDSELTLSMTAGVLLDGRVSDPTGAPIEGATVQLNEWSRATDAGGDYAMWVTPGAAGTLRATYNNHVSDGREVTMPSEGGATVDFTLAAIHDVEVYCAGLPDDSCASLQPSVMCTHPALMLGQPCYGEPLVCECPGADAVIRGGGEAARVPEGAEVVWLDMRYGGGITGEVLLGGEPVDRCELQVIRVPRGLVEDIPRGLFTAREGRCDADGRFLIEGLRPGVWRVTVLVDDEERSAPQVAIEDRVEDLGAIDMDGGGSIEGVLRDGLTGEPVVGGMVLCTLAEEGAIAMPVSGETSLDEGLFEIQGLPPGDYLVYPARNPLQAVAVSLGEDGEHGSAWVELETLSTELPEEQGFELVTGGGGELLIDAIAEGSAAERAGLSEGDVIAGVSLFGLDLTSLHPRLSDAALHLYSGPGMSLTVERGDEQLDVALE